MADDAAHAIYVLAGPNGAGKSSVLGAALQVQALDYYNPDAAAKVLVESHSDLGQDRANGIAWELMRSYLEAAIREGSSYAFETTLGGRTITSLLVAALERGMEVHVWYVALDTAEHHIARVKARVTQGGHDIPEERIRERYDSSRANLARLLPRLTSLQLFDNSIDGDPPAPRLLLHAEQGLVLFIESNASMPDWAKPIVGALS